MSLMTNCLQIKTQRLHGCALLQCIHEYINTGITEVEKALQKMLHCVHAIFYKQLTSWLLYGHLEDVHKEFFIQMTEGAEDSFLFSENKNNSDSNKKRNDMWNYDIAVDMLPSYIRLSLATKILSIGQTIIIFGNDPRHDKGTFTIN